MPSLISWMVSLSRVVLNPVSQNCPRDKRGCCRSGKTSHFRAARRGCGNGSRAVCVTIMVSPMSMRTNFPPYRTGTLSLHGQLVGRKLLVQSELTTSSSKGEVTRV